MPGFGARDIVAVSIPYTVGVVAAAILPLEGESYLWPALLSSACLVPLSPVLCRKGRSTVPLLFLFFLLGFIRFCSAAILGGPESLSTGDSGAMDAFCSLIDGCGFKGEKTAALCKALLTGRKDGLGGKTVEIFRTSGASHILALSGLHLGVIYGVLTRILSVLGGSRPAGWVRSALIVGFSAFYVHLTGASPSLVRAFLFICVNELSSHTPGRQRSPLSSFAIALTVQLTLNPLTILSAGFQLSYLAMLGILLLYPEMKGWFPSDGRREGVLKRIWNSMAMSIGAQVFTAPVAWWHFRSFPLCFLLTNLLALPLTELLIVSSLFCLCLQPTGLCPEMIKDLCDALAQALIFCLEVISSL